MSIRIEQIDQRSAPKETMTRLYELWCLWDAEALPDDPPEPYAQWIADMRHYLTTRYSPKWLLYDNGEAAGYAAGRMNTEQNLENAHGVVCVHPDYRGRGHARRLAEVLVDELEKRLHNRAQDSDEVVQKRMTKATSEMSHWAEYDYIVVNRDIDDSVARVEAILTAERQKRDRLVGLHAFVADLSKG